MQRKVPISQKLKNSEPIKKLDVSTTEELQKDLETEHLSEVTEELKALTLVTNVEEKVWKVLTCPAEAVLSTQVIQVPSNPLEDKQIKNFVENLVFKARVET